MSFKAKNLTFEAPSAPFLQSLRSQDEASETSRVGVYTSNRRRAGIKKDEDDGPLILDEAGNEVGREEMRALEGRGDGNDEGEDRDGEVGGEAPSNGASIARSGVGGRGDEGGESRTVRIGASKKRKVGRIIGDDGEQPGDQPQRGDESKERLSKRSGDAREDERTAVKDGSEAAKKDSADKGMTRKSGAAKGTTQKLGATKKRKKIGLSFEGD
ncbi:MAG: hypothetical protein Q9162_000878 [Coniocarpon cinnabarinum]